MSFRNIIMTEWMKMKNNVYVFRIDMPRIFDFKLIVFLRIFFSTVMVLNT